jgi:hypothetical protein
MDAFWVVAQFSLAEVYRRFRGVCCLHHQVDNMMQAASTSETLVNFYQTTRRNNPEDCHLHTRRRENLKSHKLHDHRSILRCSISIAEFMDFVYRRVFQTNRTFPKLDLFASSGQKVGGFLLSWVRYEELISITGPCITIYF